MYHCWALIRTSRGGDVLHASGHAALLLESHNEPPPVGFGTDPVAIDAMAEWARGRYDGTRDIAETARQRAAERDDACGEAFALWLGAVGRVRLTQLNWNVRPDKGGQYAPAGREDEATLADVRLLLDRAASLLERRGGRHNGRNRRISGRTRPRRRRGLSRRRDRGWSLYCCTSITGLPSGSAMPASVGPPGTSNGSRSTDPPSSRARSSDTRRSRTWK